jgi:hypothetical protein
MIFAFGFLLAGLIALIATTTPDQASRNLKAWTDRLKGVKPELKSRNPGDAPNDRSAE